MRDTPASLEINYASLRDSEVVYPFVRFVSEGLLVIFQNSRFASVGTLFEKQQKEVDFEFQFSNAGDGLMYC